MNEAVTLKIPEAYDPHTITFHDKDTELGRLTLKDGRISFTGSVDESAQLFFDYLCKLWNREETQGN